MVKFDGRIVQFGFGAVGKSFYEKITKEVSFNENNYYVITADKYEFEAFINMGGLVANFIVKEITKDNFKEVFGEYLSSGDLLIDLADTVGTRDICEWCAGNDIMYINTGESDWPEKWYSIFDENELKKKLKEKPGKYPIVLQHGNNPGLVSHFLKAALEYIVHSQFKKDKKLNTLVNENRFAELAMALGVRMVHVNDIDLQEVKDEYSDDKLYSTWCTDTFWFEMLSEATINVGTHEVIENIDECKVYDKDKGYLEFKKLAADKKYATYYPGGRFEGYLVPHEETITIAQSLEVKEDEKVVYRPTVMFLYLPCAYATKYFENAKVNDYPDASPDKPQDCENEDGKTIIRGYEYPKDFEIIYQEKISSGTEYVGILLLGEKFEPVWVGNRVETSYLYKDKKASFWQTPTITPVSMSALAAVSWMIKNKEKGGIYFPDDIKDYKYILKIAEKYISKTVYKTFSKKELREGLNIDFDKLQIKDILIK